MASKLIGKRWSAATLLALARGGERFAELHHAVAGISSRLLAVRLTELEDNHLVDRTVVPTTPGARPVRPGPRDRASSSCSAP